MIECIVTTIVGKLMPIFYKGNHLMQQTKLFQQRLELCSHGLPVISFTSNSPIMTCMGTQVSFEKLITKMKVSTLSWDIHKMTTSRHYSCRCKTWHNMLVHGLLDHGMQHSFHKKRLRCKNHTRELV